MVSRHHNVLGNFQRVGSFLEASSRIYELKVDSVHSDIIRLSSGIRRQNGTKKDFVFEDSIMICDNFCLKLFNLLLKSSMNQLLQSTLVDQVIEIPQ